MKQQRSPLFPSSFLRQIWPFCALFLVLLFFSSPYAEAAKVPPLTPKDAKGKIDEILRAHVNSHELTPEILTRAFSNYLDELDPSKTYLLKNEAIKWTSPSTQILLETLANLKKENFSTFEQLHEIILSAIERRSSLSKNISDASLPKNVHLSDFKDISWAETEAELIERIAKIRSLQIEAAEKLDSSLKGQFMQRIEKRRFKHEEELMGGTPKQRQQLVLTLTLKAISSALDSQTLYFTPAEANQFMIQVQQRLFGIGAELRDDLNGFTLVRLLEGGPAKESNKLKAGDKIIAVNQEPVVGMDISEAVELIRGPKGTPVQLTILRESEEKKGEKLDISITRGEVILKESRLEKSFEPFGDGVIGILHLFSFYQDTKTSSAKDLLEAIEELKQQHNLKGIILDLRGNAGGLLPQAVAVTGLFIKKGIVVSVKDNTGAIQHLRNIIEGAPAWEGPLMVLTNKLSASAAEIVAQTLQDYGRAFVVGDHTTYGKGTFQIFTLESSQYGKVNPKGEFKVTKGCYYTVSGKSPQLVGVTPDVEIPGAFSHIDIGEKFAKYPLSNDQIPSNFEDDLSDVPPSYRNQVVRLYKFNLQPILDTYTPYKETLKKNSQRRIELNKNYQTFLKQLSQHKKEEMIAEEESYGLSDLQLVESLNVLKDFILLSQDALEEGPSSTLMDVEQASGS